MRFIKLFWGVALSGVAAVGVAAPTFTLTSHVGDHWAYELSNAGAEQGQFLFVVDLSLGLDIQNISSPTGWDPFFTSGSGVVDWVSSDLSFDLAPDSSLDGFAFDAPKAVEQDGGFNSTFWDHNSDSDGGTYFGSTIIPGAVPEPATCAALALGAAVMLRRRVS